MERRQSTRSTPSSQRVAISRRTKILSVEFQRLFGLSLSSRYSSTVSSRSILETRTFSLFSISLCRADFSCFRVLIVAAYDSSREGGPLALFTSLYPPRPDTDENRTLTNFPTFSSKLHQSSSKFFERKSVKTALFGWVLFAIGCTIADGMLTPVRSPSILPLFQGRYSVLPLFRGRY